MTMIDLQLFADGFEGIDEDIVKELAGDTQEDAEQTDDTEQADEAPAEDEAPADADSDNKHVADTEDEEPAEEGKNIPYARFADVNSKRKSAEARVKELEALLAGKEKEANPPAPFTDEPAEHEAGTDEFNAEQLKKITNLAMQRAKERLNLTDDDIDTMEYSDDPTQKMMYQQTVAAETNKIANEVRNFMNNQKNVDADFNALGVKLNKYEDINERWNYISNTAFNKLAQRKQSVLKQAFAKLQEHRGTDADMVLVSEYFESCNRDYDANKKRQKTNSKIKAAQSLPIAPSVAGNAGGDVTYTVEKIEEILNEPDGWDNLPAEVKKAVLRGTLK